jgi:hypothetical protein
MFRQSHIDDRFGDDFNSIPKGSVPVRDDAGNIIGHMSRMESSRFRATVRAAAVVDAGGNVVGYAVGYSARYSAPATVVRDAQGNVIGEVMPGARPFAVRSSAVFEDAAHAPLSNPYIGPLGKSCRTAAGLEQAWRDYHMQFSQTIDVEVINKPNPVRRIDGE